MSDELLPKIERRNLRYDFTAKETHDLSLQLASATKQLAAIEEEKSSVTSQYGAKIKEAKASCNKLSNLVADGYEIRDVECEVQYHKPQQGKKTIIRKDSNKVTAIEAMTDWEWNLFNQPPDEGVDEKGEKKSGKGGKKSAKSKKEKKGTGKKKKVQEEDDSELDDAIDMAIDELVDNDPEAGIAEWNQAGDNINKTEDTELDGADDLTDDDDNEEETAD